TTQLQRRALGRWTTFTAAVNIRAGPASAGCVGVQGAIIAPGGEVAVDGLPGREVLGQVPPGAAGAVQVQDRLDDPPGRPDPRPRPGRRAHAGAGARRSPATGRRSGHWIAPA